ncbi:hypothetical protein [Solibacillus sp. NPDC093137]|uniref:hypothetical protein n=1 Tax=Solibacillus sp. NPDC093137 TaxID=3390678 RepID=UPI003D00D040
MKKYLFSATLIFLFSLILASCSEETNGYQSDLKVEAEDLHGYSFANNEYQIYLNDHHMLITGRLPYSIENSKSIMTDFLNDQGKKAGDTVFEEYDDVKITTKNNIYTILIEGFSMEFMKFKEHILVDEYGMEYILNQVE